MPPKRPLGTASSLINIDDAEERVSTSKKRIVEDKENRTRPAGKKVVKERKTSSTLTTMYVEDDEDELDDMLPVKARKPSKPKVKPADKEPVKSKKSKVREPTPDLVEESSRESIQVESDVDNTPDTSIEEESSIEEKPVKKARGRAQKSVSATPQPQPKPRARSVSAQPSATKVKATPTTASTGVRGRKPKLSAVPETQVDEISVVEEEDEVDDIELAPRPRQGSILPQSVTRKVPERPIKKDRIKELQTQGDKNFALYRERAEKRFKATDELVASLTAQLETQKTAVNSSQLKDLEFKVKTLQEELHRANAALTGEKAQKEVLNARLQARTQSNSAQLREELHSDLSGLIFRNVERIQGNTVFDCLQIGRNGTLHYKLAMEDKEANDPHGQIVYTPLLDPNRDEKILNVLPDYMTDEIMFAREQANMFYWRLNQYLQKKVD